MGHPANLHSVTSGALLLLKSKAPLLAKDARNGAPGRGWSGSTTGRGGKTKFVAALAEACKLSAKSPTSRKRREKWGTRRTCIRSRQEPYFCSSQKPHFSQKTREMGHPAGVGRDQRLDVVGKQNSLQRWLRLASCQQKAPLLANDARNGAPGELAFGHVRSPTFAQVKSPTSRKRREKWGTRPGLVGINDWTWWENKIRCSAGCG